MFRDCVEYQKKRKRYLFGSKIGDSIVTDHRFKYPNETATIIDKAAIPAGFDEKHLVKIKYLHNDEEEIIDCTYKEYWVKPAE